MDAGIDVSRPSRTNARSTFATSSGSSSCSVDCAARARLGARRERRTPHRAGGACRRRRGRRGRCRRGVAARGRTPRASRPASRADLARRRSRRARAPRTPAAGRRRRAARRARARRTASPSPPDSVPGVQELVLDGVERVLVVTAHPDDVDFGFAGSVAHVDRRRHRRHVLHRHRRRRRRRRDRASRERRWRPLRRDEQRAAAAVVGVARRALPRLPRRAASKRRSTCAATSRRVIRTVRPQRVVGMQSPERNCDRIYASHPGPPRGRRARRSPRCIPTRATAGRTPSSTTKGSNRGPSTRSGSAPASPAPTHYSRHHRRASTARSRRCSPQEPDARSGGDRTDGARLGGGERARAPGCPKAASPKLVRVVNTR